MNGQSRQQKSYYNINPLRQIQTLENYRGYSKILFIRPFMNTYLGYLDNDFFGFIVSEKQQGDQQKYYLMEAKEAIDYYLDRTFFHNSELEYDTFYSRTEYRPYCTALKFKLEKG